MIISIQETAVKTEFEAEPRVQQLYVIQRFTNSFKSHCLQNDDIFHIKSYHTKTQQTFKVLYGFCLIFAYLIFT